MPEFLVEFYVSRNGAGAVAESAFRARQAAEQMTREGARVRFLRTMFVPEDETCFYLYEAESEEAVREAASRAALPVERVAKAMTANVVEAITDARAASIGPRVSEEES